MQDKHSMTVCTFNDEEQSLGYFIESFVDQNYYPPHTHEYIEIQYIMSGTGTHFINGVRYNVERGNMLFLNYCDVHSQRPETTMEVITFHMTPSFF